MLTFVILLTFTGTAADAVTPPTNSAEHAQRLLEAGSGPGYWPQFRGPVADGHAPAADLPLHWSETENVAWKTPIHGKGWSSPVIWGNQLWITTATEDGTKMSVLCLDRHTGKILVDRLLFENVNPQFCHPMNSYASPTPVIREGRVWVHFGSYGTACLDTASGEVLWTRRDLPCDHWRGPGSSPVLYNGKLICHLDGFDRQYIVALDAATGETVWQKDRAIDYKSDNGDLKKAYCTPLLVEIDGKVQLISPFAKATKSYDPNTGDENWVLYYDQHSATVNPMFAHGTLYLNTGFSKAELLAVKPGGSGDITASHVLWRERRVVPSKPSTLIVGDHIFMVHDKGIATCLNAKTGDLVWQERLGPGQEYSSSLLYAGGRIYAFDHDGTGTVLAPSDSFSILAQNKLEIGCLSSPAVAEDALYVRTQKAVYRLEQRDP